MRIIFKKIIRKLFVWPSIQLVIFWPSHFNFSIMRKLNGIQLTSEQLKLISTTIQKKVPCKLLVFGLGNDSLFWSNLNRSGITIFLEDNKKWLQNITKQSNLITAFLVTYNTQRKDWEILLENQSLLEIKLPDDVENEEWDIILVDAPAGDREQSPGRMMSIYSASRLKKRSCDIFVHDCNREIEDIYCNTFLKNENLIIEVKAPYGYLRHYHMINQAN